ncbi:hypothetical protein [Candidatus Mycoplasma haematohominis]|nr:hypothetical protein [Candidatus Mycoplasma haemohominis]
MKITRVSEEELAKIIFDELCPKKFFKGDEQIKERFVEHFDKLNKVPIFEKEVAKIVVLEILEDRFLIKNEKKVRLDFFEPLFRDLCPYEIEMKRIRSK